MSAVPEELARSITPLTAARERTLPVTPALGPVLPEGLRRGIVVSVDVPSVAFALCAGPSQAGSWCAIVGVPDLGLVAAAEAGIRLERLAFVHPPPKIGAQVTAALLDALDVVVVKPPGAREMRALHARIRDRGAVLVSLGRWDGAELRLRVSADRWHGLGRGWGHLAGRTIEIEATGRGAYARPRRGTVRIA